MIPVVDAHLDLAYLAAQGVDLTEPSREPARSGVSLPSLRAGGIRLVFGTLFTELVERPALRPPDGPVDRPRDMPLRSWEYAAEDREGSSRGAGAQLDTYLALERSKQIRVVRSIDDLAECWERGHAPGVLMLMEGADPIESPDALEGWVAKGVRAIGLSWARGSRYAGGNARAGGVTSAGRALLDRMAALGVILDVSHLSDEAFDEALDRFDGAVMASHSNARALLDASPRHLTDEQARRIAARGGVIGLNLYGRFLASGRPATFEDALRHLEHWRGVIGTDHVGLGSDLDGGFTPADCAPGLGRPEEIPRLLEALARAGWRDDEIRAFAHRNWLEFLRRSL